MSNNILEFFFLPPLPSPLPSGPFEFLNRYAALLRRVSCPFDKIMNTGRNNIGAVQRVSYTRISNVKKSGERKIKYRVHTRRALKFRETQTILLIINGVIYRVHANRFVRNQTNR